MDFSILELLNLPFLIFCLAIASITYVFRTIIEFFILDNPKVPLDKRSRFWTEVFLPILPIIIGVVISYFGNKIPLLLDLTDNAQGRIAYGLTGGALSTVIFRMIKSLIKSSSNDYFGDDDNRKITTTTTETTKTTTKEDAPLISDNDTPQA